MPATPRRLLPSLTIGAIYPYSLHPLGLSKKDSPSQEREMTTIISEADLQSMIDAKLRTRASASGFGLIQKSISPETRRAIRHRYGNRLNSPPELARMFGVSPSSVRRILREVPDAVESSADAALGSMIAERLWAFSRPRSSRISPDDRRAIRERYAFSELGMARLADEFSHLGISKPMIYQILRGW